MNITKKNVCIVHLNFLGLIQKGMGVEIAALIRLGKSICNSGGAKVLLEGREKKAYDSLSKHDE